VNASAAWMSAAQTSWQSLPLPHPAVSWASFVGVGLPTPHLLTANRPPAIAADMTWPVAGDGVVIEQSQTVPGRIRVTCPTGHSAYVSDGRVLEVLDAFLKGDVTSDVTIGGATLA